MRRPWLFSSWTAVILLATSAGLAQVPSSQPAGQLHLLVIGVDAANEIYKSNSPTPSLYGQDVLGQEAQGPQLPAIRLSMSGELMTNVAK